MNTALMVKIILGMGLLGINGKIIWDWLKDRVKKSDMDLIRAEMDLIRVKLVSISNKVDKLHEVVIGNGEVEHSVVFRIAQIEESIKDYKKLKESKGL